MGRTNLLEKRNFLKGVETGAKGVGIGRMWQGSGSAVASDIMGRCFESVQCRFSKSIYLPENNEINKMKPRLSNI